MLNQETHDNLVGNDPEKMALLEEFQRKKDARSLAIPTDDYKVKTWLKALGEPRIYFAENVNQIILNYSQWIEEND